MKEDDIAAALSMVAISQEWGARILRAELDEVLDVPGASWRQAALAAETGQADMTQWVIQPIASLAISAVRQLAEGRGEDPYEVLGRLLKEER